MRLTNHEHCENQRRKQTRSARRHLGCAVTKLSDCLVIARASYERWLGTEPDEIAAAANALRELEPKHPSLVDLDMRLRRARQLRAMLALSHSELAGDDGRGSP
jgi:hypothetical protein